MPKDDEEKKITAEITLEMPVLEDPVLTDQDNPEGTKDGSFPVPPTQEECAQAVENSKRGLAALGITLPITAPPVKTRDDTEQN